MLAGLLYSGGNGLCRPRTLVLITRSFGMMGSSTRERTLGIALDRVAERFIKARRDRLITVDNIRRALREVIHDELQLPSVHLAPEDDELIVSYFDAHRFFERAAGPEPQWVPKKNKKKLSPWSPG
jgi:hypothetical protein